MTWGKIRFEVIQAARGSDPAPSMDLIDEFMNSRYQQVLESADWQGVGARDTLSTVAAYESKTDTATLTVGSASVTGVGTAWDSGIVGWGFYRTGDTALYTVMACADAAALTLDRPYEGHSGAAPGTVNAGAGYVFMRNLYALPADCSSVERIIDPVSGYPLQALTAAELDRTAGPRTLVGDPKCYAVIEDFPESVGTPVHQVELYPPPRFARGYTIEYLREPIAFDGTNLEASPPPFVSQSVLLYGVRADIAIWQGKLAQAQIYESKFKEELARLLRQEFSQRRAKPSMRMATRFTRHRLMRAARDYRMGWGPGSGNPS